MFQAIEAIKRQTADAGEYPWLQTQRQALKACLSKEISHEKKTSKGYRLVGLPI